MGDLLKTSSKVGFCLLDGTIYDSTQCECGSVEGDGPSEAFFLGPDCDDLSIGQGISVDWVDKYAADIEGQFIDITDDVDNGVYWLRSEVDPLDSLRQTDQTNDIAEIKIQIIRNVDRFEDNDTKVKVDAMQPGLDNSANLAACQFPMTIDSLSIHQSYVFRTKIITPDHDWFKFRLTEDATSSHYLRINYEYDLGNVELQLLDATGDTLEPLATSESETDRDSINLDPYGQGWYYARIYADVKILEVPNSTYHINWNYSLTIDAPVNEVCGDVNDNDVVTVADILHFNSNCAAGSFTCENLADVDGCCPIDCTDDLYYLIAYVFQSGPEPDCTCQEC